MIPPNNRLLPLALIASLTALSTSAVAGIAGGVNQAAPVAAGLSGVLLAATWRWDRRTLAAAATAAATGVALLTARLATMPAIGAPVAHAMSEPAASAFLAAAALLVGTATGKLTMMRKPWPAVVLLASAFLLRADLDPTYADRLPLFVALCLLTVLVGVALNRSDLHRALIALPPVLGVLVVSWIVPAPIPLWTHSYQDPLAALIEGPASLEPSQTLLLSGSFHPSDRVIFAIKVNRRALHPYWRVAIFSQYDGHSWTNVQDGNRSVGAEERLTPIRPPRGAALSARVTVFSPMSSLVFPGTPLRAGIPTRAIYEAGSPEPAAVEANSPLQPGSAYLATGAVTPIDDQALDLAHPESMAPYVQLPQEPRQLHLLAQRLVAGEDSPAGAVNRLVRYLRDSGQFHYDSSAGSPTNVDAAVDFLFHSRRGYCNQFATALAVLAREIGLPSRLVSGYTTGTERHGSFIVRQRDAHSWVEIYLVGQGWVTYDPTPGFDLTAGEPSQETRATSFMGRRPGYVATMTQPIRPRRAHKSPTRPPRMLPLPPAEVQVGRRQAVPIWPLPILAVLGFSLLAAISRRTWTLPRVYSALAGGNNRAGLRIAPTETPREFAERFRARSAEYEAVRLIVDLYVRERYAGISPNVAERQAAKDAWARIRGRRFSIWPAYSIVARR